MAALDADFVRGMAGGAGLILMYGLYAWRVFKSNSGDRFMESASVTLMIFVVVLASRRIPPEPTDQAHSIAISLAGSRSPRRSPNKKGFCTVRLRRFNAKYLE